MNNFRFENAKIRTSIYLYLHWLISVQSFSKNYFLYLFIYLNESIFRNKLYTSKKTRHIWLMSTIFCLVFLICVHFKHITHTNQPKHTFLVKMTVDICVRSYGFAVVCVYVCLWSHRSRQKTLTLDSIILQRYFEWTIQCDKRAHLHAMATEWLI